MVKITISKFKNINYLELKIKLGTVVFIKGESGSGKTTILRAIFWCLYGKVKKVNNNKIKTNERVYVKFEFDDFTIYRQKNPTELIMYKGENEYKDKIVVQSMINQIFGTYDLCKTTSYISQHTRCNILNMSEYDKIETLNKLSFHNENPKEEIKKIELKIKEYEEEYKEKNNLYKELSSKLQEEIENNNLDIKNRISESEIIEINEKIETDKEKLEIYKEDLNKQNKIIGQRDILKQQINQIKKDLLNIDIDSSLDSKKDRDIKDSSIYKDFKDFKVKFLRLEDIYIEDAPRDINEIENYTKEEIEITREKELEYKQESTKAIGLKVEYTKSAISEKIEKIERRIEKYNIYQEKKKEYDLKYELYKSEFENYESFKKIKKKFENEQHILEEEYLERKKKYIKKKKEFKKLQEKYKERKEEFEEEEDNLYNKYKKNLKLYQTKKLKLENEFKELEEEDIVEVKIKTQVKYIEDLKFSSKLLECPHCLKPLKYCNKTLISSDKEKLKDESIINTAKEDLKKMERSQEILNRKKEIKIELESLCEPEKYQKREFEEPEPNFNEEFNEEFKIKEFDEEMKKPKEPENIGSEPKIPDYDKLVKYLSDLKNLNIIKKVKVSSSKMEAIMEKSNKYKEIIEILNGKSINQFRSKYNKLKNEYEELKNNIKLKNTLIERKKEIKIQIEELDPINENLEDQITNLETEIENNINKIEKSEIINLIIKKQENLKVMRAQLIDIHYDLMAGYKVKDMAIKLESLYIESTISEINKILSDILENILNKIQVELKLTKKNNKGIEKTKFNFNIKSGGDFDDLSGGEGDRVSLALITSLNYINKSTFLFLDEAMGSIDLGLKEECINILRKYKRDKIILIVSQSSIDGFCDDIIDVEKLLKKV